jgi:LacI family transcriptional regulator
VTSGLQPRHTTFVMTPADNARWHKAFDPGRATPNGRRGRMAPRGREDGMANIKDVARLAGVSISTASRVVRGEGYTSPEVRVKVEKAAAELHYVPNALARSMRGRPTRMISFWVYDIVNPFFANLAAGVEDAAHEQDFTVIICSSHPWKGQGRELGYMQRLLQSRVDGIVLQHVFSAPEHYYDMLQRQHIPVARVLTPQHGYPCDLVRCDTQEASRDLTRHLISLGRRRIAALGPRLPSYLGNERMAGYAAALAEAGLPLADDLVLLEGWRTRDGYNMAHKLLARDKPDAIFAFGPRIAAGVACALRERRLRVPDDIALVCVDDFGMGSELDPFMTIVRQPEREMGRQVAQLLIQRILGLYTGEPREIVLPAQVVIRRSCGAQLESPLEQQPAAAEDGNAPPPMGAHHSWEDD